MVAAAERVLKGANGMDEALSWSIPLWVGFIVFLNVAAIAVFVLAGATPSEGWERVADTFSPWNPMNYVVECVAASPALAAYFWREKRRKRPSYRL